MCDLGGTINPCDMPVILHITVCIAVAVLIAVTASCIQAAVQLFRSLR